MEVDSSYRFPVLSQFWPNTLQWEKSFNSTDAFLHQWWVTVVMQILIQKHTDCIQNHISRKSAALDQMIRSILADIQKLWWYYPVFSLPSPWQSVLKLTTFIPRFKKGQVQNDWTPSNLTTWGCSIKMACKAGNHSSTSDILSLAWLASVHPHHWCHQ